MLKIHFKIWLEKDGEVLFGRGRYELLKGIMEYGSLAETARHLGMSYRAAWGRLKSSQDRLGLKLVEKIPSSGRGQKLTLTPLSMQLLESFADLEREVAAFIDERKIMFNQVVDS